jgi:hypothetical protein
VKGGIQDEDKKRNYERKKEKERNMKEKWQEGVELKDENCLPPPH